MNLVGDRGYKDGSMTYNMTKKILKEHNDSKIVSKGEVSCDECMRPSCNDCENLMGDIL